MIAMVTVFMMFLLIFGFIGVVRGWAKELLIVFSVVLALAAISLVEDLLGFKNTLFKNNLSLQFWFRIGVLGFMILFGYTGPSMARLAKATEKRGKIQDSILGFVFGLVSGFFVIGTIWSFAEQAQYPVIAKYVAAVPPELNDLTQRVLNLLPPVWLNKPTTIFIFVVVSFIFAVIYFL
jgi:uncharacterized membrane protein required for colicin V production